MTLLVVVAAEIHPGYDYMALVPPAPSPCSSSLPVSPSHPSNHPRSHLTECIH